MSEINITKKILTSAQKQLLVDMGVAHADLINDEYYELTPHEGTFSNPITIEMPNAEKIFKFPDFNNLSTRNVEIGTSTVPVVSNTFSNLVELPAYNVYGTSESFSDNPNYLRGGILTINNERPIINGGNPNMHALAGAFAYVKNILSPRLQSTAFGSNLFGQDVTLVLAQGGTNSIPWQLTLLTPLDYPITYNWPDSFGTLNMYFSVSSAAWQNQLGNTNHLRNFMYKAVFNTLGYDSYEGGILKTYRYNANFSRGNQVVVANGFGERNFCSNSAVKDKYKSFCGIDDVFGAPMSKGRDWYFAGGYNAENATCFDFYFVQEILGGPLNQPVPHPALHREVLSYNESNTDENFYRRQNMTEKSYQAPGYIVTEEAMAMVDVEFGDGTLSNGLDDVRISHYHPGTDTVEEPNLESDIDNDVVEIRTFTKEKYLIQPASSTDSVEKYILCHPNQKLPHSQGYDMSVKQALRYFGFVPYGDIDNIGVGQNVLEGKRAVVVEDGQVQDFVASWNEAGGRSNYNFYVSANRAFDHQNLGLNAQKYQDALARNFNAEAVWVNFCVGSDPVDSTIEQDTSRDGISEHRRYILVRKDRS